MACEELRTLEREREAVRKVFSSLSELPSRVNAQTLPPPVTGVAAGEKSVSSAVGRRPGTFWVNPVELGLGPAAGLAAHNLTSNTANQKGCSTEDLREPSSQDSYIANGKREYPAGNGDACAGESNICRTWSVADASLRYAMRAAFRSSSSPPEAFPPNMTSWASAPSLAND